jgi:hypothetical protein
LEETVLTHLRLTSTTILCQRTTPIDSDGDGIPDDSDPCPFDPTNSCATDHKAGTGSSKSTGITVGDIVFVSQGRPFITF